MNSDERKFTVEALQNEVDCLEKEFNACNHAIKNYESYLADERIKKRKLERRMENVREAMRLIITK